MNKIKAVGYIRLQQSKCEDTIEDKKNLINEYAENHNIEIIDFYIDDINGTDLPEKDTDFPEFERLRDYVYDNTEVNTIVITRFDMFNTHNLCCMPDIPMLAELKAFGTEIISVMDSIEDYPHMKCVFSMFIEWIYAMQKLENESQNC